MLGILRNRGCSFYRPPTILTHWIVILIHNNYINTIIRVTSHLGRHEFCPQASVEEGGPVGLSDGTGSLGDRGLRAASGRLEILTLFTALTLAHAICIKIALENQSPLILKSTLANKSSARKVI